MKLVMCGAASGLVAHHVRARNRASAGLGAGAFDSTRKSWASRSVGPSDFEASSTALPSRVDPLGLASAVSAPDLPSETTASPPCCLTPTGSVGSAEVATAPEDFVSGGGGGTGSEGLCSVPPPGAAVLAPSFGWLAPEPVATVAVPPPLGAPLVVPEPVGPPVLAVVPTGTFGFGLAAPVVVPGRSRASVTRFTGPALCVAAVDAPASTAVPVVGDGFANRSFDVFGFAGGAGAGFSAGFPRNFTGPPERSAAPGALPAGGSGAAALPPLKASGCFVTGASGCLVTGMASCFAAGKGLEAARSCFDSTGADFFTRLRFAVPLCVTGLRVACCALASLVTARPARSTSADIITPQRLFIRSIRRSPMARPAACGPSRHCAMAGRRGQSPTRSKSQNRRRSRGKPLRSRGIRPRSGTLPSRCTPAIPARRSGRPWRRCAVRPAARTRAHPRRGRAPGPSGTGA